VRTYACVSENIIVDVIYIDPEDYRHYGAIYQLVVDIEDLVIQPDIGWTLSRNTFIAPPEMVSELDKEYHLTLVCRAARKFGEALSKVAADKIGGRNLSLGKTEQQIQTFAGQLMQLKLILDGGALVTSRSIMGAMKAAYPEYADLFQWGIDQIDEFRRDS